MEAIHNSAPENQLEEQIMKIPIAIISISQHNHQKRVMQMLIIITNANSNKTIDLQEIKEKFQLLFQWPQMFQIEEVK